MEDLAPVDGGPLTVWLPIKKVEDLRHQRRPVAQAVDGRRWVVVTQPPRRVGAEVTERIRIELHRRRDDVRRSAIEKYEDRFSSDERCREGTGARERRPDTCRKIRLGVGCGHV